MTRQEIEDELGFITMEIEQAENDQQREELESQYKTQIEELTSLLENMEE